MKATITFTRDHKGKVTTGLQVETDATTEAVQAGLDLAFAFDDAIAKSMTIAEELPPQPTLLPFVNVLVLIREGHRTVRALRAQLKVKAQTLSNTIAAMKHDGLIKAAPNGKLQIVGEEP